jgi:hypothetical protein
LARTFFKTGNVRLMSPELREPSIRPNDAQTWNRPPCSALQKLGSSLK